MFYQEHIDSIKVLSKEEADARISKLLASSPIKPWPLGMPASIDPKLVVIGVSPGNSPKVENNENNYVCVPSTVIGEKSNFYYPDTRSYWAKIRHLSCEFFRCNDTNIKPEDALLITTHFNLGTGAFGEASKRAIERPIVEWVTKLLNTVYAPDLVVLFGLGSIMTDRDVSNWWNTAEGLKVDWKKPMNVLPFNPDRMRSYKRSYKYREWIIENAIGHRLRLVIWPNHPSRPPFTNMDIWNQSITKYLKHFQSNADLPMERTLDDADPWINRYL